ncbi:DUF2125 domain-containing protein [Asticcacaulis benevestitus]|uniref:DUF2125 domain-containing protein n=1 Tax=Asticcacaulis benevestitus DSM 16100 = ATCC BAA-896 TaxID=1121022 RepID=V4PI65_9CAUL|nr:DUF2125 domain-containing protein [Asticcacaulis benevestitus]ESQ93632.1 hypothetical protein ABENE_04770 [Asticcacaulis benevestitus DSM 16100 = ATCC BAA-896]
MSETNDLTLSVKPQKRANRWGLFGPVLVLGLLFAAWSGYWFYTAHKIQGQILQNQKGLIDAGYQASFDPVAVEGYPYRMYVDFKNVVVVSPAGRGFSAPSVQAEANAYALEKWVVVAPEGLTLYRGRPGGIDLGKLLVTGRSLRASISGVNHPIYNVALSGVGLTLTPSDPTHPFTFSSADNFEAYLRPNATAPDSADMLLRLTGARGQPGGIVGDLSRDKPLSLHVESTINQMSRFKGENFAGSLKAWSAGGGTVSGYKAKLIAGDLSLFTTSDALTLDETSHLRGKMNIEMSGTFNPLDVLGALHIISEENMTLAKPLLNMTLATQGTQKFAIDFHEGGAYVGPLKVSDAPILP